MGPISVTVSIDAPRERVFEVIADLANRPAFCDHFAKEFHLQRLESRGVGAAARFRTEATGFHVWMETVIEEVESPHRLIERGHGARADRMDFGTAWELVEGSGATTDVTVTFWGQGSNMSDSARARLGAARWYRRQWKRALKRLRALLEDEQPIEPLRVAGTSRI
jgi:uncharacterized protein YndB with AHSA1/START domain